MFGEVIGQVEFAGGPEEVELALVYAVLHPPIAHVERFGKLLAHFGIEDALSSFVVGFKGGSSRRLGVAELLEVGTDGAGMFVANDGSFTHLRAHETVLDIV